MKELLEMIREFNKERDWDQYHSPKNLAISISIEAGELLENFQWEDKSLNQIKEDKAILKRVSEELADIFIYSLNLADKLDINIEEAIKKKLVLNRRKYPIEKSHSSAKKYTDL
jgi:NTP pyrophosphatase (non-canonical NTP hydrolase)